MVATMAFRKRLNNHVAWNLICRQNMDLLQSLPRFAIASEQVFRMLMTEGTVTGPSGEQMQLSPLTDQEVSDLWTFIRYEACFDMDAQLFDAFNREVAERRARNDSV